MPKLLPSSLSDTITGRKPIDWKLMLLLLGLLLIFLFLGWLAWEFVGQID